MSGWQLVEVGLLLIASSLWLAQHYRKTEIRPGKPGLSLRTNPPLLMPPSERAQFVGNLYRAAAGIGVLLVAIGAVMWWRSGVGPPPPRRPDPAPVRVRFNPQVAPAPTASPGPTP